jgi:hypothetical protein
MNCHHKKYDMSSANGCYVSNTRLHDISFFVRMSLHNFVVNKNCYLRQSFILSKYLL